MRASIPAAARLSMVPPKPLWPLIGGDADFVAQGRSFYEFLVQQCPLTPASAVLDVGCGLGKHALHFTELLSPPGFYEGFDVEPIRIEWCRKAISARFSNFQFRCVDVSNSSYNPHSGQPAAAFRFPYPDSIFDLVFLGSVFTHMLWPDVEGYLREIARVLKPGGTCVATFYLLNAERRDRLLSGRPAFRFSHSLSGSQIEYPKNPEAAVAQEEAQLIEAVRTCRMSLKGPIRYGSWDSTPQQDQDFVTLQRDRIYS